MHRHHVHTYTRMHTIYTIHNINTWVLRPGLENDGIVRTRKHMTFAGAGVIPISSLKCLVYQKYMCIQKVHINFNSPTEMLNLKIH